MADKLLLVDGSSGLLLVDGTSFLLLTDETPPVEHFASVSFSASATLSPTATREVLASTSFSAEAALSVVGTIVVAWAKVRFSVRALLVPTIRPRGKKRRTVVVDAFGQTYGELENARHGSITWELNRWEEASIAFGTADPKAALVLEERIREVQLWRGDQLLVFGPMVRPSADKANVGVVVKGPLWHLSRRHVGKANRENRLTNPGFELGLAGWSFLKTKFFLDYAPLPAGSATVSAPGKTGDRALALRMDLTSWYSPPGATSTTASYTVVSGDTLWGIAKAKYGSGTEWPRIYNANQAQIEADARAAGLWNPRDPGHWIFPGQVFTLPGITVSEVVEPSPFEGTRWGEVFGYQELEVDGGARGVVATFTGWCKVRRDVFEGYGLGNRGLLLETFETDYRTSNFWTENFGAAGNTWGGRRAYYTDILETTASPLDDKHPFDQWVRHEVSLVVPPETSVILHARVNGVEGITYWDELSLTFDDALEFFDTDQASIVAGLVEHAQDSDFDKNDVNLSTSAPATGILRDLVALHQEHPNVWNLIEAYVELDDGIDVSSSVTPTGRTVEVHYPAKGSFRPGLSLELGRNVADFAWTFDGESASSVVIVLGSGDGSDREEAAAIDPDAFAGGLTLEEVFTAPEGTPIERLSSVASERLAVVSSPEVLAVKTHKNAAVELVGVLWHGDTLPVRIRRGALSIVGTYRVARLTLNPDDTLDLVLNRREITL